MTFIKTFENLTDLLKKKEQARHDYLDTISAEIKQVEKMLKECAVPSFQLPVSSASEVFDFQHMEEDIEYNYGIGWDGNRLLYVKDYIHYEMPVQTRPLIEMPAHVRRELYEELCTDKLSKIMDSSTENFDFLCMFE